MAVDSSVASHKVVRIILDHGERFALLIDRDSALPDPYITRYAAIYLRSKGGSINTMLKALGAIALLLDWVRARHIDLERRIETIDLFSQEETTDLTNWLRLRQERSRYLGVKPTYQPQDRPAQRGTKPIVTAGTHYARVIDVRNYLAWRCEAVLHQISVGHGGYKDASQKLADWVEMLARNVRSGESKKKYGLTHELRTRFLQIIQPDSLENPFSPKHRHRNYALLLLYYELGLRRAEPLALKSGDLKFYGAQPVLDLHRRPDDTDDPRHEQPLLKTAARTLPVGASLQKAIEDWLIIHRSDKKRYPGAKKSPYVFVAANGRPMALRTVYDLFVRIRERFPEFSRDFSAHILRHSFNDRFSELCDQLQHNDNSSSTNSIRTVGEVEEVRIRTYLMGWKKNSTQAVTYTHRFVEAKSAEYCLLLQGKSTNGRF